MLAQAPGAIDLVERWISQKGGVLEMSLLLNVILLTIAGYLFRLVLKKEAEKTEIMQKAYSEAKETAVEMVKGFTELSTLIKGQR